MIRILMLMMGMATVAQAQSLLEWKPSYGIGLKADYLLTSNAESVIVLFNTSLNGREGCYFVVAPATGQVWIYNDTTGDWIGQGDQCRVGAMKELSGDVRLTIEFEKKWTGEKLVYLTERNGDVTGNWSVAGEWKVVDTGLLFIRPVSRLPVVPAPVIKPVDAVMRRVAGENWLWEVATRQFIKRGTVYRNGLKQTEEVDYKWVSDETLQTWADEPWELDDVVTVIYKP